MNLALLRQTMQRHSIDACIIPSADPHLSEYPDKHWQTRAWLSGFDGSAGTLVVTAERAGLWTDSRYYLQAENQLKGKEIKLFKDGLPETPGFVQWLSEELPPNSKTAVDGRCASAEQWREWEQIIPLTDRDIISEIWIDRPQPAAESFFTLDIKYSGSSALEKLNSLRAEMRRKKADICLLTALDDIAWLLNMRRHDVAYNPVITAFAVVETDKAILFKAPVNPSCEEDLAVLVEIADYNSIYTYFSSLKNNPTCLVDAAKTNFSLYKTVASTCKIVETVSPVSIAKSIKNKTETAGFRRAMERDGVALIHFLLWLEKALENGEKITELSVADKLRTFRSRQPLFFGESFHTIAGYGANGAIVHYAATSENNAMLMSEGFLLLDSGAQYLDGTTDITRTVALGALTVRQKRDFTLVLKGHIALATAHFPQGTRGIQLDALARKPLWDEGLNYGHGTGHGVGHFLCVHEYPPAVSSQTRHVTPLLADMVLSSEPGLYRTGEYGIRIENLMLVKPLSNPSVSGNEQFFCFETLTLCPIDTRAIAPDLLTENEKAWLNDYHRTVFERLSPHLGQEEKTWLAEKCSSI